MEIVYLDLHFLVNLAADYLLCLSAGRVCALHLKRLRYLAAALLGAVFAVLALLPGFRFLNTGPGKLLGAVLLCIVAYRGEKNPLRCSGVFLGISALFGGAVWALGLDSPGSSPLSLGALLFSFALCYGAVRLFFSGRGKLPDCPRASVCTELSGRQAEFTALLDTGNQLADPLSGCGVMLACPQALWPLFPGQEALLSLPAAELLSLSGQLPELRGRFRLLPYRAVGSRGMLAAFRPDSLRVDGESRPDLLIALSPAAAGDGFEAIL